MIVDRLRLDGKQGLMIGAGGHGMGSATTLALAQAGALVAGVARTESTLQEEKERLGESFVGIQGDVTEEGSVDRIVDEALSRLGHLDFVVNLVGGTQAGDWARADAIDVRAAEDCFELNMWYVFRVCQAVGRHMIDRRGGVIINVTSGDALTSSPNHAPYGMAKSAVESLTQTLAIEWAQFGIRVNALSPGRIRTPRIGEIIPPEFDISDQEPVVRALEPEEVSGTILFLASDLSSGINGQVISVDGGLKARAPGGTLRAYELIG